MQDWGSTQTHYLLSIFCNTHTHTHIHHPVSCWSSHSMPYACSTAPPGVRTVQCISKVASLVGWTGRSRLFASDWSGADVSGRERHGVCADEPSWPINRAVCLSCPQACSASSSPQLCCTCLLCLWRKTTCVFGGVGVGGLDRQKTESQMVDVQICETWQVFKCAASQGVELCWHYSPFSREGINHFTWVKDLQVSPTQDNQFHLVVKQQQNQFDMPHWLQLQHTAHLNMLGVSCVTDLYSI